jgi:ABC-2 type transport system permease protein
VSGLLATFERELRAYFFSSFAYVVLFFVLVINGFTFSLIVGFLSDPRTGGETQSLFQLFFGGTFLAWLMIWVTPPLLTMRLLAEERRSGSIESLMTAPVSETDVVIAKYLASLIFYIVLWLPTLAYVLMVAHSNNIANNVASNVASNIDWGPIWSAYLAIILVGGLFLAVGVFCSAATKNQIVAAVSSFAMVLLLTALSFVDGLVTDPRLKDIVAHINLFDAIDEAAKGIVDTRRLVYPLSLIIFFLFLASRTLAAKKWR